MNFAAFNLATESGVGVFFLISFYRYAPGSGGPIGVGDKFEIIGTLSGFGKEPGEDLIFIPTKLREQEGVILGGGYVKPLYLEPIYQSRIPVCRLMWAGDWLQDSRRT